MIEQGFDPLNHTIQEFIEFCKCLEFTKDIEEMFTNLKRYCKEKDRKSSKMFQVHLNACRPCKGKAKGQSHKNLA